MKALARIAVFHHTQCSRTAQNRKAWKKTATTTTTLRITKTMRTMTTIKIRKTTRKKTIR